MGSVHLGAENYIRETGKRRGRGAMARLGYGAMTDDITTRRHTGKKKRKKGFDFLKGKSGGY